MFISSFKITLSFLFPQVSRRPGRLGIIEVCCYIAQPFPYGRTSIALPQGDVSLLGYERNLALIVFT